MVMKSTIFWDIRPCTPLKVNGPFGGKHCLHLQGRRTTQARNQRENRWQAESAFIFRRKTSPPSSRSDKPSKKTPQKVAGRLYPEDGSNVFLRNVGWLSTDYTALYSRRHYSSTSSNITSTLWMTLLLWNIEIVNRDKSDIYTNTLSNIMLQDCN
jgi:hypothetical protein